MFRFLLILIVSGFIMGEQAVIVDVRTQDEWNQGHLETALHIELDKLKLLMIIIISKIIKFIFTVDLATDRGLL